MISNKKYLSLKTIFSFLLIIFLFSGCKSGPFKFDPPNAQEVDPNAKKRAKKNIEEGRGFRLSTAMKGGAGGNFEFASSNPMWRASLEILDFTPLTNVDYSGGVIITDWFSEDGERSIKISVRFLTNEIRSDALDINVFLKKCSENLTNCSISKNNNDLVADLNLNILKKATKYQKKMIEKRKKNNPYIMGDMEHGGGREKPKNTD